MRYLAHHLLTNSSEKNPERVAVSYRGDHLTYGQLQVQANQLARMLQDRGVRPGDRVGVYLNKSLESIVSIFGILKAGGVYVPLDPNSPPRRIALIVQNCQMRCLVTSVEKFHGLASTALPEQALEVAVLLGAPVAGPDLEVPGVQQIPWGAITVFDPSPPTSASRIDNDVAYILYTSGSTGNPKGVMLTHRHALTFVDWACNEFQITHADRLSNHAPLHFDLSIFDIFGAFQSGATVVLVPEGLSTFPIRLAEFIAEQGITIWYSVPSALILLVLHGQLHRFPYQHLREILFAGEVFPIKYLRLLMQTIPHAAYYNLYGPTETNVCTFYKVPPLPPDRVKPIPIGKPCRNTDVFALNDSAKLIAPGEHGELYVRGALVTKGYWADPQRTGVGLIPNPLEAHSNEYVYRTGDIVTLDEDGNYILIGRRDHMIKSRGYRIELGEIETALYAHPNIHEAAVVPIPDEHLGNRLKAFLVLQQPDGTTTQDIKKHCAQFLPAYMVPEVLEFRTALPKTSTGKIDRALLAYSTEVNTQPSTEKDYAHH